MGAQLTAQGVGEAALGSALQSAAGEDNACDRGAQAPAAIQEPAPETVILGDVHVAPAARIEVGVGSDAEVRAVHMGMRAISSELIGGPVELMHIGAQAERVEFDDARYGAGVRVGMFEVSADPVERHMRVGIGVGQPNTLRVAGAEVMHDGGGAETTGRTGRSRRGNENFTPRSGEGAAESGPRKLEGPIGAAVGDEYHPGFTAALTGIAGGQHRANAAFDGGLFVLRGDDNAHRPGPGHDCRQQSMRNRGWRSPFTHSSGKVLRSVSWTWSPCVTWSGLYPSQ